MSPLTKKIVSLNAELISDGRSYSGFIENFSEDGIYMRTAPTKTPINFTLGTTLKLKFQPHSGEILCLSCKVKWLYKTPVHGLTNSIGLEIIEPAVI